MTKRNVLIRVGQVAAIIGSGLAALNGQLSHAAFGVGIVVALELALDH